MRASTLFGLAIALFLAAGAVVLVRTMGWLDLTPPAQEPVQKVKVLVAKTNIFAGTTASVLDVMVRDASPGEIEFIKKNQAKVMPAYVEAANLRVAVRNITVGEILQHDFFKDPFIPDPISQRLEPGMRSVNIVLSKDRAAGGLIRQDELVDVYLTTAICADANCSSYRTATAPLAKNLKVVAKRDSLWTMMMAIPEDKPVSFILQANAYRAALIEMAKNKGTLSLMPSMPDPNNKVSPAVAKMEDNLAKAFLAGEAVVSDRDLESIFKLQPQQSPEPPLAIEHYTGVKYVGTTTHYNGKGKGPQSLGYSFYPPDQVGSSTLSPTGLRKDCPTCGKK